ncbi:ribosome biogenesis GTP-binding protein YihA/YsxC [Papillibacter cinnamivorans]|nr:ribosome biogenesis GTP-binding protein YihA/YsxC [Papillibacter cinnamivorans]
MMNFQNAQFILSAARPGDFPSDGLPQVVFAGRSNVGKSSVINCLLGRRNLARVGSSPGKTAHVNYFKIDGRFYFVDLPGYGYAKVSRQEKDRWRALVGAYFADPSRVALGILVVDARHKPTEDDRLMASWFQETGRPFVVAANKTDKLSASELAPALSLIAETLELEEASLLPFSARTGTSREVLLSRINICLSKP